ncbi:hypothetical protein ACQP2U_13015 [Nocardia sp. CA-084685]|uniref:hypothetical protein n=1 Tax=Nocardia sp. CA-084685 TaxID=3239970 RepID=UPI003D98080A
MRIKKYAATAVLTIAAIGITCGTSDAQPPAQPDVSAEALPSNTQGTDHGVAYCVDRGRDGKTLTAVLTGGTFDIDEDTINVIAADGTVVSSLPLQLPLGDQEVTLTPRLDANGTKLVADVAANPIGYWRKTSPHQRSIEAGMGIGAAIGGLGGALLGIVIGIATMGLLIPITLPVGLLVGVLGGMAVGGAAGAAIPNSDVPDQWDYQQECHGTGAYQYCW